MSDQEVKPKKYISDMLLIISFLLVVQSTLALVFRRDMVAFGGLLLLVAMLFTTYFITKGKR